MFLLIHSFKLGTYGKNQKMTQAFGMIDQEDWRTIRCEEGYDEFGFGQAELEKPVEFSCLVLYIYLKYELNIRIVPRFPSPLN